MLATQQLRLSARIVALGLGAGVGLSVRLWYATDRLYPHTPLFAGTAIPSTVELTLLVAVLLSLAVVVVHRHRPALWIGITLTATAALVIFDQSRLQPWTYPSAVRNSDETWTPSGRREGATQEHSIKGNRAV